MVLFALAMLAGCAASHLPRYPAMSYDAAVVTMRDKAFGQFTLQGWLTLDDGSRGVTLDVALVVEQPSRVRLRAWKLGQAVFDLTVREDGVYIFSGRDGIANQDLLKLSDSIRSWVKLLAPIDDSAELFETTKEAFETSRLIDGVTVKTRIDRNSLTVTDHAIVVNGGTRATIVCKNYTLFESRPWPTRIEISEQGRSIVLRTRNIIGVTKSSAFDPPKRATQVRQ